MGVDPAIWGPALGVGATGLGVLIRWLIVLGSRSVLGPILGRLDGLETRFCGELAANTEITAATAAQVAHQAAQLAFIQGRLGLTFQATGDPIQAVGVAIGPPD